MKKFPLSPLLFLLVCFITNAFPQPVEEIKALRAASVFMTNISARDESAAGELLYKKIRLNSITDTETEEITKSMLLGKTTITEYLHIITGSNTRKFLNGVYTLVSHRLLSKVNNEIPPEWDEKLKSKLYYIRGMMTYKDEKGAVREKKIEIELIKIKESEYKVFGFIF
ncbi:hypothetical protein ACFL6D_01115 [Spirochaetota bacterium]